MKITANKFVAVTYDLNVGEGEERELMEKAVTEAPLKFIFGTGAMLPAFEDALKGLEVGDKFDFSIAPADAYGEYVEDHVLDLPKNIFEVEGKFDSEVIKEGNTVPMMWLLWTSITRWLVRLYTSAVRLSMFMNRQQKKLQRYQLRLADVVADATTAEAIAVTTITKVVADVVAATNK